MCAPVGAQTVCIQSLKTRHPCTPLCGTELPIRWMKLPPQRPSIAKLRIPRSKSAAMWLLMDLVRTGHRHWTRGTIRPEKLDALVEKLDTRFGIRMTDSTRARHRRQGRPTARLVVYPVGEVFFWWMLIAGPEHRIQQLCDEHQESLFDAYHPEHRLQWGEEYLLRPRQRSRVAGGGNAWTWYLTRRVMSDIEHEIVTLAAAHGRHSERTDDLERSIQRLRGRPMFGGVRVQASRILLRARRVWNKTHTAPTPEYVTGRLPFFGGRPTIY